MSAPPLIMHLDLDAFFAAVEQRDKPSLRGKPVIVGGLGDRGVVAAASYEARRFGVHSAMPMSQARRLCPHGAYLTGRFDAYRRASAQVMEVLGQLTEVIEPLSLDEAFVDLTAAGLQWPKPGVLGTAYSANAGPLTEFAHQLKRQIATTTGGLTCSIGVATSKLLAKIASDADKPDGVVIVPPGTELARLEPLPISVIPGVGPSTQSRLHAVGVHTVRHLRDLSHSELLRLVGRAHGQRLYELSRGVDPRPVEPHREAKSVSVEETYPADHYDPRQLHELASQQAHQVCQRLQAKGLSGTRVTLKLRFPDFSTLTRSTTLSAPTNHPDVVARRAQTLLHQLPLHRGVRLLGVGVAGLTNWVQERLFPDTDSDEPSWPSPSSRPAEDGSPEANTPSPPAIPVASIGSAAAELASTPDATPRIPSARPPAHHWRTGMDVHHSDFGDGWVWGAGSGLVTIRFETATNPTGPIRSFRADDPALRRRFPS